MRMRVAESSNSRSRLARNSHALSATLSDSVSVLSLNLNLLKFFLRVVDDSHSHFARGDDSRCELKKTLMRANSKHFSSSFDPCFTCTFNCKRPNFSLAPDKSANCKLNFYRSWYFIQLPSRPTNKNVNLEKIYKFPE